MSRASLARILPLAITQVDAQSACVGAVTSSGTWVRPEPVSFADVDSPDTSYRYFHWTRIPLEPSTSVEARPEDRSIAGAPELELDSIMDANARLSFLTPLVDAHADAAFEGARTLGLLEVVPKRVYAKRSVGGHDFLRAVFEDGGGSSHDWIVADLMFARLVRPHLVDGAIEPAFAAELLGALQRARCFFTVALTRPNHRFPGKFRGCQPLVVGVHTVPDANASFDVRDPP